MKILSVRDQQLRRIRSRPGFIAALDQSGGSTPSALRAYGIEESAWSSFEQMFAIVHQMRTRIMRSPSFNGERILGAILFEDTLDREVESRLSADYLWSTKRVVPFVKVDKGLADEADGVQLMKPMPALAALLEKATARGVFGTKMRSVIRQPNPSGIRAVVDQQFEVAARILSAGLVPIVEPEVDIHCVEKARAESLLEAAVRKHLDEIPPDRWVMLKLTLPEQDGLYWELVKHPQVLKVVALSGGYSLEEANARLRRNQGVIASFSRVLLEGLRAWQSDAEFDAALDTTVQSIFHASTVKQPSNALLALKTAMAKEGS
jgi:fructose-bisphosphate aldolase class I